MSAPFLAINERPLCGLREEMGAEIVGAKLVAGDWQAFYVDAWGGRKVVAPDAWRGPHAREMMERGKAFERRRKAGGIDGPGGVAETNWDLYVALPEPPQALSAPTAVQTSPQAAPPPAARPKAGGAPRRYDWEGALLELVRLREEEGVANKSPGDLAKHLEAWFISTKGEAPADSEIKKRVRAFRAAAGEN